MRDFNINLINYNGDKHATKLLDTMFSHSISPFITSPTRITRNTKTLIDNIFYDKPVNNITTGNLCNIISDHLIQFLIEPWNFSDKPAPLTVKQRCFKALDKLKFKDDISKINWDTTTTQTQTLLLNIFFKPLIIY